MSPIGAPRRPVAHGSPYAHELEIAIVAVTEAGRLVHDFYERTDAAIYTKADGSSVTDADLAADRVIRQTLATHVPNDPILTEEGRDERARLTSSRCWIADPIDGTDQFIRRTGAFDVFLALVVDGRPVVVAGYNPPSGLLFAAEAGQGAWISDEARPELRRCTLAPGSDPARPRLATSVWFGAPGNQALVERIGQRVDAATIETITIGFSPRMFLAGSSIDAYLGIRPGTDQTMGWEWDFAVADLFLREVGGMVSDLSGNPHRYNKPMPRSRNGLVVARDPVTHQRVLAAVAAERDPDRSFSS
jgi:3'-phosphoadenosine 5'-phosphosulfate (PAPS) 3'-phosphatase